MFKYTNTFLNKKSFNNANVIYIMFAYHYHYHGNVSPNFTFMNKLL